MFGKPLIRHGLIFGGKTIDEVTAPPDLGITQGDVWSFTTELLAYPIENVTATASSSETVKGPENTVNGSGLDADGLLHGNVGQDAMWLSGRDGSQPTWIAYEFDNVYRLYDMWVWNSNESVESAIGFGARDVTIEYSVDGIDYTTLGTTHEFTRAPGNPDYAHNTTVDLGGIVARYIKLTINSNWGGVSNQYGLSEVRFNHIPTRAWMPDPGAGEDKAAVDIILGWRAGREAAMHDVYMSTDEQAVIDGTAPLVSAPDFGQCSAISDPGPLELGTTYYWRVDEVNDAEIPSTWRGEVWSFTTAESVVVDNFESYNNIDPPDSASNRIFDSWIDGFTDPTRNGAIAGNNLPPYAETRSDYVHGGTQAMPLSYNNNLKFSEATLTLTGGNDWTKHGIGELSLWFRGETANAAEPMYVALNGTGPVYHDNPTATQIDAYEKWTIPLQKFVDQGVDLAKVTSITIGFGTPGKTTAPGGAGQMYFDDILLYPAGSAP
jgi:hypothetical protein